MATTNLGLKTFGHDEPIDFNDWNDNFVKIDAAVGEAKRGKAAYSLLDNGWFVAPVNQRVASTTTQWAYCLDRWIARISGMTLSATNDGLTITSSESGNRFIYQKLAQGKALSGKTVTLAVCDSNNNIAVVSCVLPTTNATSWTNISGDKTAGDMFVNITDIGNGSDYPYIVSIGIYGSASSVTIRWAALYEGAYSADTLPAYVPKGYAAELAECRRYYKYIGGFIQFPVTFLSDGWAACAIDYSDMRVTPSVQYVLEGLYIGDAVYTTVTNITARALPASELIIDAGNSISANKTGTIRFSAFSLSADL